VAVADTCCDSMFEMKTAKEFELELVLQTLEKMYGFDLHSYTHSSVLRRLENYISMKGLEHISSLIPELIHQKIPVQHLIDYITIQHSELFRDVDFFKALRDEVLPYISSYPEVKIWVAGCANGEEVYSLCILLDEAGLLKKSVIYATDLSVSALNKAKTGILDANINSSDIRRYNESGGTKSLSEYFIKAYGHYKIKDTLLQNVVFEQHNLVQDGPFISAQLVLCRNVMIYFNKELKQRVVHLLKSSLAPHGYLGLGSEESLRYLDEENVFKQLGVNVSLYKKNII